MVTVIDQALANPFVLPIVIAGIAGAGAILFYKNFIDEDEEETIDADGMKEKFVEIFTGSVKSQGAKVNSKVYIQGTTNTPRLIGYATKAKDLDVQVKRIKKDNDNDKNPFEDVDCKGTIYEIVEGSSGLNLKVNVFMHKLGYSGNTETYDIPKKYITSTDDDIRLDKRAHFVKINGIKRDLSVEGMGRAQETAFSTFHESYIDTKGKIPQQYAVLNNRLAGQLKGQSMKSESIMNYQEKMNELDKKDGMDK